MTTLGVLSLVAALLLVVTTVALSAYANHRSTVQASGRVRPRSGRHTATPFNLGKIAGGRG